MIPFAPPVDCEHKELLELGMENICPFHSDGYMQDRLAEVMLRMERREREEEEERRKNKDKDKDKGLGRYGWRFVKAVALAPYPVE